MRERFKFFVKEHGFGGGEREAASWDMLVVIRRGACKQDETVAYETPEPAIWWFVIHGINNAY